MSQRLHLIKSLALAALALLAVAPAEAATLYVSEFNGSVTQVGTTPAQIQPQIAVTDQTVALSGSSATSSAFGTSTHTVMLMCDEGCSVKFGTASSVAATTSNYLLQQGVAYRFGVAPGWYVAAIANAAGNSSATITPSGTQNVNNAQVSGTAVSVGNGTTDAGTQRVTISSDSTGQVNAIPKAATGNGATYTHIAAGTATTVIKASAGTLYAIVMNSKATSTATMNVYDNASGAGTVIATVDGVNTVPGTSLNYGPAGINFANGLTIITATANSADMTVVWK